MTIVVSIRVNDGIVLASDSATSFVNTQTGEVHKVYNHADKIFNLIKGQHIGAMTYGSGSIGSASISTLSKDLRKMFTDTNNRSFFIDLQSFSIQEVAEKALKFFHLKFLAEYPNGLPTFNMGYRICGYSSGSELPEAWEIRLTGSGPLDPIELYDHSDLNDFGPRWAGESEALDRLILGVGSRFPDALVSLGSSPDVAKSAHLALIGLLKVQLHMAAMPIQDAIDLARFLAETASRFAHFSLRAPTVGGAIELATVTKHEGFRWVSRKHFYSVSLNPTGV